MRRTSKRMLSLLLAVLMCLSLFPVSVFAEDGDVLAAAEDLEPVFAPEDLEEDFLVDEQGSFLPDEEEEDFLPVEEEPAAEEPEQPEEPGEAADPTEEAGEPTEIPAEPAEEQEPAEDPVEEPDEEGDPAEEPGEETEPAEEPEEETEGEDAEETEENTEDEEKEDAEAVELPYGFKGMGEDYVLSEEELARKLAIAGLPAELALLVPDVDYVEGQLIVYAPTEEYAQQVAEAYNADLEEHVGDYALIALREATVLQAVECAANPEIPLPAAEPNWIANRTDGYDTGTAFYFPESERYDRTDWAWYGDPGLDPNSYNYQYHHDILGDYPVWSATKGQYATVSVISDSVRGTAFAKLVAANLDGSEGVGVAPEANINSHTATDVWTVSSELQSLYYSIVLVDYCCPYDNSTLKAAVNKAQSQGCVIIAPMGDDGSNRMVYPAAYDGVIAVAATDASGALAPFSNYGAWCTISAPGVALDGNSGTAYAAALVAGAAALYQSVWGYSSIGGFEAAMKKAATKGGAGAGILNTVNMFGGVPDAPTVTATAHDMDTSKSVWELSQDGVLTFHVAPYDDHTDIRYTLDGSNPQMKNGETVNGDWAYDGDALDLKYYSTYIEELELGKTYTLKAIAVSGLGIPSKLYQQKFKLIPTTEGSIWVNITGPNTLPAGKKTTLTAVAESGTGNAVEQSFIWTSTWTDDDSTKTDEGAKVDKKGVVTSVKGRSGWLNVKATHSTGLAYGYWYLRVEAAEPVAKAVIYKDSMHTEAVKTWTMSTASGSAYLYPLFTDKDDNNIGWSAGVKWTSSNEKVVKVVYGNYSQVEFEPVSAGKATLKATALDGSNKSASVSVTVTQGVDWIDLQPKKPVGALIPGATVQFQATVWPKNAANKNIIWELDDGGTLATINPKNGAVTLPKGYAVQSGDTVRVYARSAEDPVHIYNVWHLPVLPVASSLEILFPSGYAGKQEDAKGNLVSLTMLNDGSSSPIKIYLEEVYRISGSDVDMKGKTATVTFSKPELAYGYFDGSAISINRMGDAAGSTKVTIASACGTKKVSFTLNIVTPISGIQLTSGAPGGTNAVAYGKSFKLKATPITAYGKPTDAKLVWHIMNVYDRSGTWLGNDYNPAGYNETVTMKNGVLSVSKAAASVGSGGVARVEINVETANYWSSAYGYYTVYVNEPITKIEAIPTSDVDVKGNVKMEGITTIYPDILLNEGHISHDPKVENLFTVTSSNPKLLGAQLDMGFSMPGSGQYEFNFFVPDASLLKPTPQTVTITVKANDGSNKSFAFKVKVSS